MLEGREQQQLWFNLQQESNNPTKITLFTIRKMGHYCVTLGKGAGIHGHGCGVPMAKQFGIPFNVSDWQSFVLEHDRKQKRFSL